MLRTAPRERSVKRTREKRSDSLAPSLCACAAPIPIERTQRPQPFVLCVHFIALYGCVCVYELCMYCKDANRRTREVDIKVDSTYLSLKWHTANEKLTATLGYAHTTTYIYIYMLALWNHMRWLRLLSGTFARFTHGGGTLLVYTIFQANRHTTICVLHNVYYVQWGGGQQQQQYRRNKKQTEASGV